MSPRTAARSTSIAGLPVDTASLDRLTAGTSYADAVHQLLAVVRTQLGMEVAWVSEFVGTDQVLRFVDAQPGAVAPDEGAVLPLNGSFCARVLDGRFPTLIPDARGAPEVALLDVTAQLHIGAYVGVPLLGPQGVAVGMLCAVNERANPGLTERDVAAMQLLAAVLHDLQERALDVAEAEEQRKQIDEVLTSVIAGEGRHAVLQPIVDLATGRVVAAEGLTRFTVGSPVGNGRSDVRSTAQWFDDADRLGRRADLEMATARAVLDLLETVPPEVDLTVNLGPDTLVTGCLDELLAGRPLSRIVLEVTEHAPVADYDELRRVLRPFRGNGLRLAIDDAGAGYSSLQHVLAVEPDLVKIDMALVRGADTDVVRRTLLTALAGFAGDTGCRLVAEGVETAGELRAMRACGVHLAQGYYLAEPAVQPRWSGYPA